MGKRVGKPFNDDNNDNKKKGQLGSSRHTHTHSGLIREKNQTNAFNLHEFHISISIFKNSNQAI